MKSFGMWKIPVMLVGFGVGLMLSPACKAQAEVAPDHYDGTESFVAPQPATQNVAAPKVKQTTPASQARSHQTPVRGNLELAAKTNSSSPSHSTGAAKQEEHQPAAVEPKKP